MKKLFRFLAVTMASLILLSSTAAAIGSENSYANGPDTTVAETASTESDATELVAAEDETETPQLVVYSENCPSAAEAYAVNHYETFLYASIESGAFSVGQSVSLGTPFTIASPQSDTDVYYFPIISDEIVVATFRVYLDETEQEYTGIMSAYLAAELNELSSATTNETPAMLFMDNGNLMVRIGEESTLLLPSPLDPDTSELLYTNEMTAFTQNTNTVAVLDRTATVHELVVPFSTSKYLNLSIIETQGANNWCGAYSTAIILRYLMGSSSSPTAQGLMELAYRRPTSQDTFGIDNTLSVSRLYGYYPRFEYNPINAIAEIDADKPVYVYSKITTGDLYHAYVIRGYNMSGNVYYIWNPWNSFYETMDMHTNKYVANSTYTFHWEGSVFDW